MKKISCVILDLDNTLFDWVGIWYSSFRPFLDEVVKVSGLEEDALKSDFKKIHQKYRTSEYPFRIEHSALIKEKFPKADLKKKFNTANLLEKEGRNASLSLYPGVLRTLWALKRKGIKIIAYTDSMSFYTIIRLKRLGLDGVIDVLYSVPDHIISADIDATEHRSLANDFYELQITEHKELPLGEIKPNPAVLLDIINSLGFDKEQCIYIGDSLDRDIAMAQEAKVTDVWARYGKEYPNYQYDLLKEVTHWPTPDVEREETQKKEITASYNIDSFADIMNIFDFEEIRYDLIQYSIEAWKKSIDVQQHFNEVCMKIRSFFISFVTALLAFMGIILSRVPEPYFLIWNFKVHYSMPIFAALILSTFLFYFIDRFWYHRLLVGAVKNAIEIENKYSRQIPGIGLSKTIGENSPIDVSKETIFNHILWGFATLFGGDKKRVIEENKIHSDAKISMFYKSLAFIFFALLLVASFSGGIRSL